MTLSAIRKRADELYELLVDCNYEHPQGCTNTSHIENALLEVAQEARESALKEAANEFLCNDVAFFTPKEAVKLILFLLKKKKEE